MKKHLLYLGLDVHADSITIALAEDGRDGEVRLYGMATTGQQDQGFRKY